jgi:hypothetical protein
MATGSRTLWKGAITFGLVHIPVGLHTAATEEGVDFDWLDKRSMDPVGYKRVNKRTGREITKENIVKGVEYEDDKYVIISPKKSKPSFPRPHRPSPSSGSSKPTNCRLSSWSAPTTSRPSIRAIRCIPYSGKH